VARWLHSGTRAGYQEAAKRRLRGFGYRDGGHAGDAIGGHGVVTAMPMSAARQAFFFNIGQFPARGDLAIPANHAAARESRVTEKSNETHDAFLLEEFV
jgi:hypothetical protein